MNPAVKDVAKQVRRLRWLLGLSVLAGGTLILVTGILAIIHAGLLLRGILPGSTVISLGKALGMTLAGLVGWFAVMRPLSRIVRLGPFLSRFEGLLRRDSHLCLTLEVYESGTRPESSEDLVAAAAGFAAADLHEMSFWRWPEVRRAQVALVAFLLVAITTVVVLTEFKAELKEQVEYLIQTRVDRAGNSTGTTAVRDTSGGATGEAGAPCRSVRVAVTPPAYAGNRTFEVPWGFSSRVLVGSTVDVVCDASAGNPLVELMGTGLDRERLAFDGQRGSSELSASFVVTEHVRAGITAEGRVSQPGTLELQAVSDRSPECNLESPRSLVKTGAGSSVSLAATVDDDFGLGSVLLRYQIVDIDPVPLTLELTRPNSERHVEVTREIIMSSLGAEAGDRVRIQLEARDNNDVSGPSVCTSAVTDILITRSGPSIDESLLVLVGVRNQAIDLLAEVVEAGSGGEFSQASGEHLAARALSYAESLQKAAEELDEAGQVKADDVRRLSELAVTVDEENLALLSDPSANRRKQAVQLLGTEVEEHVWVLHSLAEKLFGETLMMGANRLQAEIGRLRAASRELVIDETAQRDLTRTLRRVHQIALKMEALEGRVLMQVPRLFSRETGDSGGRFGAIAALSGELISVSATGFPPVWKDRLETLSLTVERTSRTLEAAYASSMSRLSSAFRNAQTELLSTVQHMLNEVREVRGIVGELAAASIVELEEYYRQAGTLAIMEDLQDRTRQIRATAQRLDSELLLPLDRKQPEQFIDALSRLEKDLAALNLDEALSRTEELMMVLQAMDFSLGVKSRFADTLETMADVEDQVELIASLVIQVEGVRDRIVELRPARGDLESLQDDRLVDLGQRVEALKQLSVQIRDHVAGQQKMFPVYFGRLLPLAERAVDAFTKAGDRLTQLRLDEALSLLTFAEDTLVRLLELLEDVPEEAGNSSMLRAGGSQPEMEMIGRERTTDAEPLRRYLEAAPATGEDRRWNSVVEDYWRRVSP